MEETTADPVVSERMRLRRRELRLSQRDLAELIDISQAQIVAYEKGTSAPTLSRLRAIAQALQTSIAYLYGETDNPEPLAPLRDRGIDEEALARLSPTERLLVEAAIHRRLADVFSESAIRAADAEEEVDPGE